MEHQKTFTLDKSLMTDKIKNEAKKRMELLQLSQRVIDEFINNGNIMMSDFDGQIVDVHIFVSFRSFSDFVSKTLQIGCQRRLSGNLSVRSDRPAARM